MRRFDGLILTVAIASSLALGAGCGRLEVHHEWVVDPPPGAAEAMAIVAAVYDMKTIPTVYFYGAEFLNCGDGYAYKDQAGTCVRGDQENGVIILAYWPGMKFSDIAPGNEWPWVSDLPHEFAHEASDQRGEGGCADHKCHWYEHGGEGQQATEALAGAGL